MYIDEMRVKMGADEEWRKAAMGDDTMVAELLLQLNKETPTKPVDPLQPPAEPVLPLHWSVRQRRSKAVSVNRYAKSAAPRASPSTPLSWSGATSGGSGGGGGGGGSGSGSGGVGVIEGGLEESSKPQRPSHHPKRAETTRSKGKSEAITSKRPRKKKTLAELKEEEIALLKERRQLKRELATLHINLEKERATNENLKRMKLDMQSLRENESAATVSTVDAKSGGASDPPAPVFPTSGPAFATSTQFPQPDCSAEAQKESPKFVVPDLNLPLDDDRSTKVLCEVS